MKILVVFGSASDENISLPLVQSLSKEQGFDVEYQVISAHRNLEQLQEKISNWKGDTIVAGAGLAAALPGVVAAMTPLPVFGVPVPSQFGGLDSLCSIAQMPPGVPVISCGPGKTEEIVAFVKRWNDWREKGGNRVHFVVPAGVDASDDIAKAETLAKEKGLAVTSSDKKDEDAFNIYLVARPEDVHADEFCIHVPFFAKKDAAVPANYLSVLDWTNRGGLWLGANNTRNAVQSVLRLKGAA